MNKNIDLFDLEEEDFDTVMANDIKFTGNIRFAKPFMIKGFVTGSIESNTDLVIDTDAQVNAEIKAGRVLVKGKVNGNITGKDLVLITATGSVYGDITCAQVVLEPGSDFSGRCTMLKNH